MLTRAEFLRQRKYFTDSEGKVQLQVPPEGVWGFETCKHVSVIYGSKIYPAYIDKFTTLTDKGDNCTLELTANVKIHRCYHGSDAMNKYWLIGIVVTFEIIPCEIDHTSYRPIAVIEDRETNEYLEDVIDTSRVPSRLKKIIHAMDKYFRNNREKFTEHPKVYQLEKRNAAAFSYML